MKYLSLSILLILSYFANSQTTISGKVTDVTNTPLKDVEVSIKSDKIKTYTDEKGEYQLNISDNSALIKFYKEKYREQLVEIKNDTINIVMSLLADIDIYDLTLSELMLVSVVSSTQTNQEISDAPSVISAIAEEDVKKYGINSTIDLLSNITGIETSMGVNGDYRISIRGNRKDGNILILIDGQDISDFYDGKSIYDLPVNFIDRIEVIRGPGSALYGTNAVAGVINIITKKEEKSVSVSGGTHNTFSGDLCLNKIIKSSRISLLGGYYQTDGANVQPRSEDPQSTEEMTELTNRWMRNAYIKTNFEIKDFSFSSFGIYRNRGSWVGPLYFLSPNSNFQENQLFSNISYTFNINKKITIKPQIYNSLIYHDFLLQEHPAGKPNSTFIDGAFTREKYNSSKTGISLHFNYNINSNINYISGFEYQNMKMLNYDIMKNYNLIGPVYMGELDYYNDITFAQKGKSRTIFAGFSQLLLDFDKIGITTGLRYDKYSDFGESLSPRLGIVYKIEDLKTKFYQPFENIYLKFLYGRAFRTPTFKELYDVTNLNDGISGVKGNPNLKAGIVNTTEFSVQFENKNFDLKSNIFYNQNRNVINIYDEDGTGSPGIFMNTGNINGYGIEIETNIKVYKKIIIGANFSKFENQFYWNSNPIFSRNIQYIEDSGSNILMNIPQIRINANITLVLKKFQFFASMNYGSKAQNNKRYLIENRFVEIPPYLLSNFKITYNITSNIKFSISGNNIGKIKFSDPEESTNIRLLGKYGMGQPCSSFLADIFFLF